MVSVDAPPERTRLDEMLPALQALDDEFAMAAVRRNGQPITCAKGCSASTEPDPRVPVTPVEAYAQAPYFWLSAWMNRGECWCSPDYRGVSGAIACSGPGGWLPWKAGGRRPIEDAKAQARRISDLRFGMSLPRARCLQYL